MTFPTDLLSILARVDSIDPVKYGKSRNFISGAVTYLSPYISRGVISTKQVFEHVMQKGYKAYSIEKFLQELAWRDYWQLIWFKKGDLINSDLRNSQEPVANYNIPKALVEANTGINAIDKAIEDFYQTGYLHNHLRMYIASIATNMAHSHWNAPARWMYYYLLDGDWASNTLSWQWVCGANSNKKYVANQENINKYTESIQHRTFLDIPYSSFPLSDIPGVLRETAELDLKTKLPETGSLKLNSSLPTFIYNSYNLDPNWNSEIESNRILLLEPGHFQKYPKSDLFIDFILGLSSNIPGIQVFVGSFEALKSLAGKSAVHFKEHPFNAHYEGIEEPRDWMFSVNGDFRSFFAFWKKCKKELKSMTFQPTLFDEEATSSH